MKRRGGRKAPSFVPGPDPDPLPCQTSVERPRHLSAGSLNRLVPWPRTALLWGRAAGNRRRNERRRPIFAPCKRNLTGYPQDRSLRRGFRRNLLREKALWPAILSASSAVLSCCFLSLTVFFARRARRDSGPAAAQARSAISHVQSLRESVEAMQLELERLANRVKMQKVRNMERGPIPSGDMPDPYREPNEWRAAMNRKLAQSRTGVKL